MRSFERKRAEHEKGRERQARAPRPQGGSTTSRAEREGNEGGGKKKANRGQGGKGQARKEMPNGKNRNTKCFNSEHREKETHTTNNMDHIQQKPRKRESTGKIQNRTNGKTGETQDTRKEIEARVKKESTKGGGRVNSKDKGKKERIPIRGKKQ